MSYEYNGVKYSSKKHPMLEYIFRKYYKNVDENIVFYLDDISDGYKACNISEPASISNTILDLTRKNTGINSRLPRSISEKGYDLRKKTGQVDGRSYAGEFVQVGIGNVINSWLEWPEDSDIDTIEIDSSMVPDKILQLIRNDEGALFSIIDYTDTFSKIFDEQIHRVQNPMKWQPNEIDGFYISDERNIVYPVEAKALTTNDDINLEQMNGAYFTVVDKLRKAEDNSDIQQIAIKMIENGILVAIFPINEEPVIVERYVKITYEPKINNWK